MFEHIENLKIISVLHKTSQPGGKVASRKANAFIIRVSGAMEYDFDGKIITVGEGEMIFVPKDSRYTYQKLSEENPVCVIINLEGDFGEVSPYCYPMREFYDIDYMLVHMADLWKFGNQGQKYTCYSLLYNLLSYVSNLETQQYQTKKKFEVIEPAINYLKRHIYNCDLKIDELHKRCGVSDTYFRKIFISKFGMSPKQYVINKRVSYAKSLIDSGEFSTVKELAQTVGYQDALYFGKVFKQHYGVSPMHMNQ